jgi:hypothetical protein
MKRGCANITHSVAECLLPAITQHTMSDALFTWKNVRRGEALVTSRHPCSVSVWPSNASALRALCLAQSHRSNCCLELGAQVALYTAPVAFASLNVPHLNQLSNRSSTAGLSRLLPPRTRPRIRCPLQLLLPNCSRPHFHHFIASQAQALQKRSDCHGRLLWQHIQHVPCNMCGLGAAQRQPLVVKCILDLWSRHCTCHK